jgi:Uma2 family endonuclease
MSTTEAQRTPVVQTPPPIVGWDSAGIRMTPAEFDAIEDYDELYRYELVNGVMVVNPIPLEGQASPNEFLGYLLNQYKYNHPEGAALDETLQERYIHLENSRRQPDRVIWAGLRRLPNPREDVPTIAIEFVSEGRRNWICDYETKRDEYLQAGVREYWVIDRFVRTMTVYSPGEDGFQIQIVTENETYHTPLLPCIELPLARLLAEAAKWNA